MDDLKIYIMKSDLKYPDICFVLHIIPYTGDSLERTFEGMSQFLEEMFRNKVIGYDLHPSKRIISENLYEVQLILSSEDIDYCIKLVKRYIDTLVSYNEISSGVISDITFCKAVWENGRVV